MQRMDVGLLIDLAILAFNIHIAVTQRGTIWGWIATAIVCWMIFAAIKMIKEI